MLNPIQKPRHFFFDNSGKPLAGGRIDYVGVVYQDPFKTVPHQNPIFLDEKGSALLYFDDDCQLTLYDRNGLFVDSQTLPTRNEWVFFYDKFGYPLRFGKVFTYHATTTQPKASYGSADMSVVNDNPIVLDDDGKAQIYINAPYRLRVYQQNGVLVGDNDVLVGDIVRKPPRPEPRPEPQPEPQPQPQPPLPSGEPPPPPAPPNDNPPAPKNFVDWAVVFTHNYYIDDRKVGGHWARYRRTGQVDNSFYVNQLLIGGENEFKDFFYHTLNPESLIYHFRELAERNLRQSIEHKNDRLSDIYNNYPLPMADKYGHLPTNIRVEQLELELKGIVVAPQSGVNFIANYHESKHLYQVDDEMYQQVLIEPLIDFWHGKFDDDNTIRQALDLYIDGIKSMIEKYFLVNKYTQEPFFQDLSYNLGSVMHQEFHENNVSESVGEFFRSIDQPVFNIKFQGIIGVKNNPILLTSNIYGQDVNMQVYVSDKIVESHIQLDLQHFLAMSSSKNLAIHYDVYPFTSNITVVEKEN